MVNYSGYSTIQTNVRAAMGEIQYEITFAQLEHIKGNKILDFG